MAQMVEVLSISAAERRLKEPRTIPRPGHKVAPDQEAAAKAAAAATHGGLLSAAAMGGRIVVSS